MICPGTSVDRDNPGCRRGGCQGRMPELPLFAARTPEGQVQQAPSPSLLADEPTAAAHRLAA
jgi:hypothetical protein